ncbi:hypothetical protein [Flagellimonas oceani]|uniref:hypothetical protein n=1 Tax=Flagellimonas oceani TaxID=2698672 RepID=UPI001F0D24A9|nr:hypothetical protein [Allomuricauda oceani]
MRFKRFSKEEIIKQNYRLDFTWLKEELSSEITEISDPHELALNLIDELEIITDNFKEVIQLLDENE